MLFLEDSSTILFTNNTSFEAASSPKEPQPVSETSETTSILGETIDFTPDRLANVEVLALASPDEITIQGSPIVYVRQGGVGSGTSWADAYGDLQTAINNAPAGSEIWVAAGTYLPSTTGDRAASFSLKDRIEVYGGFGGLETDRGQRNPGANVTTLSGDIGAGGNNADNSYHVVSALNIPTYAILDGFTITGGNANQRNSENDGGGISVRSSRTTFSNLVITGNVASDRGGGIYTNSVQSQFSNVTVISNQGGQGGGIFTDDTVNDDGIGDNQITFTNSNFILNTAQVDGGAIRAFRTDPLTIDGTIFDRNSAGGNGGGIFSTASTIRVTNSTFSYNLAQATTNNVTNARPGGGGINVATGSLTAENNIFWGNSAVENSQIALPTNARVNIGNSIIQGGYAGGVSILDADPLFVDAVSGNLSLQASSPAIDRGNNASVPTTLVSDIVGNPRIFGSAVDLGAYEFFAFDAAQYGASNPDLIRVYGANLDALRNHYLTYGRSEGRATDNFDEFRYIASSYVTGGDLINAFHLDGSAATLHYLSNGLAEGRSTTAFIPSRYLESQDDLLGIYGTNTSGGTQHFISYGFAEGRNPNLFPSDRYIASYRDLINAFGYNIEAGSNHYLFSGQGEGRQITFNPESYLALNPDVAQAYNNDLNLATQHYILYGAEENRPIA